MIYIVTSSFDRSTSDVIDWLFHFNCNFYRHNFDEDADLKSMEFIKQIKSYWYRKGVIRPKLHSGHIEIDKHLTENNTKIFEYQEFFLQKKKYINTLKGANVNKLIVLELAKSIGLLIPPTTLLDYKNKDNLNSQLIYKPVNEGGVIQLSQNEILSVLTQEYNTKNRKKFGLTFFQKKISKKYELRIFYFMGKFWAMAIFSQKNKLTTVDFRNYDANCPNRTVPYKLPEELENKLDALMKTIGLNCGSIDMIVSIENDYYFLEVNPVGQFGMISIPCNYKIEKVIAKYLSNA